MDGPNQLVTTDNFSGLVTILDDFATVAGATVESQKGRRHESLTSPKYVHSTKHDYRGSLLTKNKFSSG